MFLLFAIALIWIGTAPDAQAAPKTLKGWAELPTLEKKIIVNPLSLNSTRKLKAFGPRPKRP